MTPFPLAWPENMPRHKGQRETGAFRTALHPALENARKSLMAFGRETGSAIKEGDIVFSSNVGGLETRNLSDPGIALWFMWEGVQRCIAVDRYSTPAANLQAIHHIIEADRTKLRHGSISIVRASYKGFAAALPAPGARGWRAILGIPADSAINKDVIEAAYREAAKSAHPDKAGGSNEAMAELNAAKARALKELPNG